MDFLASVPLPVHPSSHDLWYPSTVSQTFTFTPTNTNVSASQATSQQTAQQAQAQQSQQRQSLRTSQRTIMTHLRLDENAIAARKQNIRRHGAGWLRPPGIGKTMQGLWDERAEREEAEAAAQREAALAEAHAAAAAAAEAMTATEQGGEANEGQGEHDLDDDVPEAEAEGGEWLSSEDEEDSLPMNEVDGDFAPDGIRMSVGGVGAGNMAERDLDDDVPEAGSYQHTDTDIEDSSSVVEEEDIGMGRTSLAMDSFVGNIGLGSSPMPHSRGPGR